MKINVDNLTDEMFAQTLGLVYSSYLVGGGYKFAIVRNKEDYYIDQQFLIGFVPCNCRYLTRPVNKANFSHHLVMGDIEALVKNHNNNCPALKVADSGIYEDEPDVYVKRDKIVVQKLALGSRVFRSCYNDYDHDWATHIVAFGIDDQRSYCEQCKDDLLKGWSNIKDVIREWGDANDD